MQYTQSLDTQIAFYRNRKSGYGAGVDDRAEGFPRFRSSLKRGAKAMAKLARWFLLALGECIQRSQIVIRLQ